MPGTLSIAQRLGMATPLRINLPFNPLRDYASCGFPAPYFCGAKRSVMEFTIWFCFAPEGCLYVAIGSSLSEPRATIFRVSSANGRCNAFPSSHGARIQTSRSSSMVRITGMTLGWIGSTIAFGDVGCFAHVDAIQKAVMGIALCLTGGTNLIAE